MGLAEPGVETVVASTQGRPRPLKEGARFSSPPRTNSLRKTHRPPLLLVFHSALTGLMTLSSVY